MIRGEAMSRENAVRLISLTLALCVVIIGLCIERYEKNNYYKLQIENEYSRAVEELSVGINNIALLLEKSEYASAGDNAAKMASEIVVEAQNSKNALSRLPVSSTNLDKLNKFLSQVGNYAVHYSAATKNGKTTDEDRENIKKLTETAKKVSAVMNDADVKYNNIEYWSKHLEESLPEENITTALSGIEEELNDYPTLIYDGPYSDHKLNAEPKMIKEAFEVTEEKARQVAERISGEEKKDLILEGTGGGEIDTYIFANGSVSVTVSRFGGYPVYMRKTRDIGENTLSYEQALKRAKRFLDDTEHGSFTETYYFTDEGICVINFAFLDGETVCYPDLIKVGVALDTGEIVFYEAKAYLYNHIRRAFASPKYTVEEASAVLNDELKILQTKTVLIPSDSGEKRCYEFHCKTPEDSEILVYIGVSTLKEEEIFVLLYQDGGVLVK